MQAALGCPRAAVRPQAQQQLAVSNRLPRCPSRRHSMALSEFPPARPPANLYLQSLFLDAAHFQVVKEAIGAGWLGQGRWRPLAVMAVAGTLRWQHLDVSRWAGPVPPRPGGASLANIPAAGLGDRAHPLHPDQTRISNWSRPILGQRGPSLSWIMHRASGRLTASPPY